MWLKINSLGKNPNSWINKILDLFYIIYSIKRINRISPVHPRNQTQKLKNIPSSPKFDLTHVMDSLGSDKGSYHSYTTIYESLLSHKRFELKKVLEIGIGSTDDLVPSNMGPLGKPGASLRGWKKFAPNAEIVGADIDDKVMFSESNIQTIKLDQLDRKSFNPLLGILNDGLDLAIIDGLHTPRADLNSVVEILPYLKSGGNFFIEDVGKLAIKFLWPKLLKFLRSDFSWEIYPNDRGNLIHIYRL